MQVPIYILFNRSKRVRFGAPEAIFGGVLRSYYSLFIYFFQMAFVNGTLFATLIGFFYGLKSRFPFKQSFLVRRGPDAQLGTLGGLNGSWYVFRNLVLEILVKT